MSANRGDGNKMRARTAINQMLKRGCLARFSFYFVFFLLFLGLCPQASAVCDCTQEGTTGVPQPECEALVLLYDNTAGAGWYSKTNWNQATAVADWEGVSVANGNVSSIDLSYNNLKGAIPAELGNVIYLTDLKIPGNELTGSIPIELGAMSALETLDLSNNQLTGGIPSELGSLSNLITLNLSANQLGGGIPAALEALSSLRVLNLAANPLGGEIPAWLGNMTSLTDLKLYSDQLVGNIPPELGSLSAMQNISFANNQLSGAIPAELGNLTNLQGGLYLSNNQLNGELPVSLGNLNMLKTLYLNNNDFTGNIPTQFGNLRALEVLYLNNNQLSGPIPEAIGGMDSLKNLYLSSNQLDGPIPSTIGSLVNLELIYLDSNRISGTIPGEIGNLSLLKKLYLYSNQLVGEIPQSLTNLSALSALGIRYNGLWTTDSELIAFLDAKNNGWADTQTIPPAGVSISNITENSVKLNWTPITYTDHGGYYIVKYSTIMGGGYIDAGFTTDKFASEMTVADLDPGTTYYFVVQTFTPAHSDVAQQNDLFSEFSQEVFGMTGGSPGIPEIEISGNNVGIPYGSMTPSALNGTDLGEAYISAETISQIFKITNTGNAVLFLTGMEPVEITGTDASDFSIFSPPTTTIDMNGGTTTFTVGFSPTAEGVRSCVLTIHNNDPDESMYEFVISGIGLLPSQPSVSTISASAVTSDSAQVNGEVTSDGGAAVSERGVCWSVSPDPTVLNGTSVAGSGVGLFSAGLADLTPNTLYYAKAYAKNSVGIAYGPEITFTTDMLLPSVNTMAVGLITQTTAVGGGFIQYDGGGEIVSRGVCWSVLPNPILTDSHTVDGIGVGQFESDLVGLDPGTTYYVRAYATVRVDVTDYTSYGAEFNFSTRVDKTGDVNGDGGKDLSDAILVLRILTGIDTGTETIDASAAVDQNGVIGLKEALFILREVAGLNG